MLTCELIPPNQLTRRDRGVWQAMIDATPAFASPILSPQFVDAVAAVRDDTRVAVLRQRGQPVAFLALHHRPSRFARPAGAPFSDYSALITFPNPGFSGRDALKAAGIDRFQAIGLVDPYGLFSDPENARTGEIEEAYGIDLSHDGTVNQVNKKQVKNINRLRRNLIEAHGDIGFRLPDRDRAWFEHILAIKSSQTRESGLHDFLGVSWVRTLLDTLFDAPESGLHGVMLTMTAGDKPVLSHYGVRLGERIHPWVSSFDATYGAWSPGQIFLTDIQAPLKAAGVTYYDLSTGQSHYKNSFCNTHFPVRHTRLYGGSSIARFRENFAHVRHTAQAAMGRGVDTVMTRLGRRFDQIACLELDTIGRARGVAFALGSASKRLSGGDAG